MITGPQNSDAMPLFMFPSPAPPAERTPVIPVFLPHAGCTRRCVYCSQHAQTGVDRLDFEAAAARLEKELARAAAIERSVDVGFYGGTFTRLDKAWQERLLAIAGKARQRGVVRRIRCSTRPDAVDAGMLARLAELGLDMIELGVESFDAAVLEASGRGYAPETVTRSCALIREAGLELGMHLMAGLPGQKASTFLSDVDRAVELAPSTVRIHPTLVLRGSPLESAWKEGGYHPLGLNGAVWQCAEACLRFWRSGIRVIRLGLAGEPSLVENVIAGPWHPGFGQMARSMAIYLHIRTRMAMWGRNPSAMYAPRRHQGELFGHRGALVPCYARLGLTHESITWWQRNIFLLQI